MASTRMVVGDRGGESSVAHDSNEEGPGVTYAFPGGWGIFASVFLGPGGLWRLWPGAGEVPTSREKAGFSGRVLSLPLG